MALGRQYVGKKGVRVLALDGGGIRGMAASRMLAKIEEATGRKVWELFDVVGGTSTGTVGWGVIGEVKGYGEKGCVVMIRARGDTAAGVGVAIMTQETGEKT